MIQSERQASAQKQISLIYLVEVLDIFCFLFSGAREKEFEVRASSFLFVSRRARPDVRRRCRGGGGEGVCGKEEGRIFFSATAVPTTLRIFGG